MIRARALILVAIGLTGVSGCSEMTTLPSTPTPEPPIISRASTLIFAGELAPGGTQTYAITIGAAPVRLSLGSLTDENGAPLTQSLRLTFGVPQGTGCGPIHTTTTSANLSTHLQMQVAGGTYCVAVADIGQLSSTADFAVRITLGDPTTRGGGGTIEYSSTLLPGGSTSRSFDAHARGDVTIFLDTINPASVPSLKLGFGFPRSDGGGCQLNQTFTAPRGFQVSFPVEAGTYCVQVADPGILTGPAVFALRIQHP